VRDEGPTTGNPDEPETKPAAPPSEADLLGCIPGLQVVLLRLTRNPELTKDLAQEVLISTLKAIRAGRIESVDKLAAYLYTAARHAFFSHVRERPADKQAQIQALDWTQAPPTPLDACVSHELQRMAHAVLEGLSSDRDRALIRGFYMLGKTKTELMQAYDLSRDLFDKVVSRARIRMRMLMDAKLNGNPGERVPGVSEIARSTVSRSEEKNA